MLKALHILRVDESCSLSLDSALESSTGSLGFFKILLILGCSLPAEPVAALGFSVSIIVYDCERKISAIWPVLYRVLAGYP